MELIPILSTIILVATISTFILAVGAYILYKIREGRVKVSHQKKPDYLEAEYFVPNEKREHKVFVEEVLEPKPNVKKKEAIHEPGKVTGDREKQLQNKFRVVEEFGKESRSGQVNLKEVEMPGLKYEKYIFNQDTIPSENSINEEIKWR